MPVAIQPACPASAFHNRVRALTAANRSLALGTTADERAALDRLGIRALPAAERAELLSTRNVYDDKGVRQLEELGPLRRVELTQDLKDGPTSLVPSGTSVTARTRTVNRYDEGRPTNGTATVKDQVTRATSGAQVREHPDVHAETRATATVYDWVKGMPVETVKDPDGLAVTNRTEYDDQGRVIKEILPGGTGTDAATRVTTYWSASGTGTCQGRPEWADLVCSTGPAGAITGGGSEPSGLPTSTTEYTWWGSTAKVTETANGVTRTTTTGYDGAGRQTTVRTTGGLGPAVPEITTEYDPASGQVVKTVSPTGGTITRAYDKLGRSISYTDADGGVTRTQYDLLGRQVKVTDSVPSTVTYAYDHTIEPRGLTTRTTDSVAGVFQAGYDPDGGVTSEKLPGGYTLKETKDPSGSVLERLYTRDSDGTLVYADTVIESIHSQVTTHAGWSSQRYRYDALGRLTEVEDTTDTICTRRTYAFDQRTNRISTKAAAGTPGEDCPATGGSTTTYGYDTADRLIATGYTYDALGRSTSVPGHGTIAYYANDLAHRQTADGKRQTWTLDAALRYRGWTVETNSSGSWTTTETKRNHYNGDGDNPRWIVEDATNGALSRNVESATGDLAATTSATGNTVLQLANIHGDVALQLPQDAGTAPVVLDADEYGNPRSGQEPTRYSWLGAKQRSAETLTNLTLMGVRLYNPHTGRFLSLDPVHGGGDNLYGYPGDPINQYDLDGKRWWRNTKKFIKRHRVGIAAVTAGLACGIVSAGAAAVGCAVVAGALAGAAAKKLGNRRASWRSVGRAAGHGAGYGALGGALGAGVRGYFGVKWTVSRQLNRWSPSKGRHARPTPRSHRRPWWRRR